MKGCRILVCLISFLLFAGMSSLHARQLDSSVMAALDSRLAEYVESLKYEGIDTQKAECDFLIDSSSDSLIRQFIALRLYDHYLGSPVMGTEAVAIHIFDRWFQPGLISMGSDLDLLNARIFADFNRQSLVGEKAPSLVMETMDGDTVRLFSRKGRYAEKGDRHSILFFYDAGCIKCRMESILLRNLLETEDYPVDFYAVYAGDDRQAWTSYVAERLDIEVNQTGIFHLWDPTLDSDFQRKYGVVQTPRMLLVGPDQIIKGRGLDVSALSQMLHDIFSAPDLEYGAPSTEPYFDYLLSSAVGGKGILTKEDVSAVADRLASAWLQAGDTTMCRQMLGDFLYYLAPKTGEGIKEGLHYVIDEYVLGRNDIWKTKGDSLKVIGFAQIMDDLLSKAECGSRIMDFKVPGDLIRHGKKIKAGDFKLRRLKGEKNIIIFYTEGCHICDSEKAAVRELVAGDRRYRALFVNIDYIADSDPVLAESLFDSFDLSTLPYILMTDRKGYIVGRYMTLQKL